MPTTIATITRTPTQTPRRDGGPIRSIAMKLFDPGTRDRSPENKRLYAHYELAHTAVDFAAAICFVIGSVLFFWNETQETATWLFLIGSLCFALKPTLRLAREVHFLRRGEYQTLMDKFQ
jgi:hypothetical protein